MLNNKRFLLLILIALFMVVAPVMAQDTDTVEVDVVAELVLPRLEEYGANLPDHYGTIRVDAVLELMADEDAEFTILDVREATEIEEDGIIADAVHIPMRELGYNLDLLPDIDANIIVVCKGGFRATIAMTSLHVLGYENAQVLVGGMGAWLGEDLPVVEEAAMVEATEVPEAIDPLMVEFIADYMENLPQGWGGVSPNDLFEEMFDEMPILLDVRSDGEWADPGYIDGAEHIWIDEFTARMDEWPEDLDATIVVYCASGYRGNIVASMLRMVGYTNVRNLSGGIGGWIAADLPVEMPE